MHLHTDWEVRGAARAKARGLEPADREKCEGLVQKLWDEFYEKLDTRQVGQRRFYSHKPPKHRGNLAWA